MWRLYINAKNGGDQAAEVFDQPRDQIAGTACDCDAIHPFNPADLCAYEREQRFNDDGQ
jgi:hypothetical protein